MENNPSVPMLFPLAPDVFFTELRRIIQEEMTRSPGRMEAAAGSSALWQTPGLTQKPLYKMSEVCRLFQVSRPTVYAWIKQGKLRCFKIRSRLYFPGGAVEALLDPAGH